uniref:Auxin response factor n=1 Tax=Hordeum vulgare subsp. vulgare TaxID=112509 RepID=A0A8I6WLR4_HORVV
MAGIDLNTVEEDEEESSAEPLLAGTGCGGDCSSQSHSHSHSQTQSGYNGQASSPVATPPSRPSAVCLELWHACAGPVAPMPRKGSVVVYLPQGHLDHLGDAPAHAAASPAAAVPPHVFCRVVDVTLHADATTDEVYAQLSLLPENEELVRRMREATDDVSGGEDGETVKQRFARMPHMFCKTLTASDTSTHGGFSVPRRAAEDCFPHLDYNQQRPSQELVAKDLHGTEWKFRHIYRGQPRRHLLTTGWSAFVNKKKLVSGDAVLFLRGDDGELRLGVRRAVQLKNGSAFPALYSQCSNLGTLANVTHAVSTKSMFQIFYNPRLSQSEFIVPYWKFTKSISQPFSVGWRFKMRYESEDAAERRYTGIITGTVDADPRWRGSKWKCLLVRWDDDGEFRRPNRLSPWEIELTSAASGSHLAAPTSKRMKPYLPHANPEYTVPYGGGRPDFAESAQLRKVLQGQEVFRPYRGSLVDARMRSGGFHQQDGPYASALLDKWRAQQQHAFGYGPPAQVLPSQPSLSPPSVLMFQKADPKVSRFEFGHGHMDKNEDDWYARFVSAEGVGRAEQASSLRPHLGSGEVIDSRVAVENTGAAPTNSCKIFGISLAEKVRARDEMVCDDGGANYSSPTQPLKSLGNSCATVHEQRPVVGRAIDVQQWI